MYNPLVHGVTPVFLSACRNRSYGIIGVRGRKVTPFGRWGRDAFGGSRLDVGAKASLPAGRAAVSPRALDVSFNRESGTLTLRAVWPFVDGGYARPRGSDGSPGRFARWSRRAMESGSVTGCH